MRDLSRRSFVGGVTGLTAASLASGLGCVQPQTGEETAGPAPPPGSPLAGSGADIFPDYLKAILDNWVAQGKQFAGDQLPPDAESDWKRLIDFYFPPPAESVPIPRSTSVNAANLCPSLRYVDEMVTAIQNVLAQDISFPLRNDLAVASQDQAAEVVRIWTGMDLKKVGPRALVALTRNTTEGNNIVNNGLQFDPATENVVLWDQNHPTNYDAWKYRQATHGWPASSVRWLVTDKFQQIPSGPDHIPTDPQSPGVVIDALRTLVDRNTRVVSLSWQSNECGMVVPMAEIVEAVRAINPSVHIHADCAQTFGVLDLKLQELGVDSAAGSFHKWPCGPKMVGLLYMKDGTAAERFLPNEWGYDEFIKTPADYGYPGESGTINPDAQRFAYLGQQNDATLVATLVTGLFHIGGFHPNVTEAKIEARAQYLGNYLLKVLIERLPEIWHKFTPERAYEYISTPTTVESLRSSVFLFRVPVDSPGDVMKNVYEQYGYSIAALEGMVRISPTFANTTDDIDGAVDAVIKVVQAMNAGTLPTDQHLRVYA